MRLLPTLLPLTRGLHDHLAHVHVIRLLDGENDRPGDRVCRDRDREGQRRPSEWRCCSSHARQALSSSNSSMGKSIIPAFYHVIALWLHMSLKSPSFIVRLPPSKPMRSEAPPANPGTVGTTGQNDAGAPVRPETSPPWVSPKGVPSPPKTDRRAFQQVRGTDLIPGCPCFLPLYV